MLNFFDLYDLHAILVNIRNNESDSLNEKIISKTLKVLKDRNCNFDINQFRDALKDLELSKYQEYSFVYTQNVYSYIPYLIKEDKIYKLFEIACEELLEITSKHNYDQVRDLADTLHNLPLMLAEQNLSIPKNFWYYEVKYYRNKWDKSFLREFQKNFYK